MTPAQRSTLLFSVVVAFAACSENTPRNDGGTGGMVTAGASGSVSAGMPGGAGKGGTGASGGSSGSGAGASGGVSGTSGGAGSGGTGAATGGSSGAEASAGVSGSSGVGGSGGTGKAGAGGGGTSGGEGGAAGGGSGTSGTGGGAGGPAVMSGLPVPPGASDVPKPSGAAGGLEVLDWAGFKSAVSYTFDDSNSSQIQNYDALNALGVRYTFYLQTGKSESSNQVWARAVEDGHELGNHTKSHLSNGTGQDVDEATAFIEGNFDVTVYTMAAPNGAGVYTDLAKPRFFINRGVQNGIILPNDDTDPFTLRCFIPQTGANEAAFNSEVESARAAGGWRVILVHGFTGGSDGAYQPVPLDEFAASIEHAKSLGDVWIDSVVNVAAYWRGQKTVTSVTPTTSGSDQTWTWTLPDHFPPGKYLRVTVTGGTLKQGGNVIPWDSHGYYEVALDEGSLTLSP